MQAEQPITGVAPAAPVFDYLGKVVGFLACLILASLVLLVSAEVFLRGIFGYSMGFVEEMTGYLVVALTLFGAAMAVRSNSLFKVQIVFDSLPFKVKRFLGIVFAIVAIALCVILAMKTFDLVDSSMRRGKFAPTVLRTPLWIPQMLMPIGFSMIAVFLLEHVLILFRSKEGN